MVFAHVDNEGKGYRLEIDGDFTATESVVAFRHFLLMLGLTEEAVDWALINACGERIEDG